ncbi:MAG: hypothetical protein IJW00_01570 [Clostridia bacterium]|nr:hypothetical protein [Clostridia bacterium]MBQ9779611.1 hypothetical protein [Clostridia bacterium]
MSRYLVKNKYTYEKVRQADYTYHTDNWALSQNHVAGRFIYEPAEPICVMTLTTNAAPIEIALTPEQGARFAGVSGFMISQKSGEGMLCRVTLWGAKGESFTSVCYMTEEPRLFSAAKMDFVPVRMTLETKPYAPCWDVPEVEISMTYGFVLNTLGEVGGQSHFYEVEGGTLTDDGGAMVLGLQGEFKLTSPVFPDYAGTPYNMLMPRRNTVFMVITNKSTAKVATLTWATSTHPWGKNGSVSVELAQDGEPHAYYFNLSKLPELCDGRLSQFVLSVEGEGEIILHRYSFEQEKPIIDYAGVITACKADPKAETITVSGKVKTKDLSAYRGGVIRIYTTTMANAPTAAGVESTAGKRLIGECPLVDDFAIDNIPLRDEYTTLLPYQLLAFAEADGQKPLCLCERFYIENYEAFDQNPYAFDLPDYSLSVLDCGAYGDAVHDDTKAIQETIDRVSKAGGGQVFLPGSDDRYGRRYMVTNLLMRSNVDLHFGDGAVLWQSQLKDDYDYEVTYGHDGVIPGINWTHNLHVSNLPLIQAANIHHFKVTGHGTVRMMDTGSEEGVDMPGYASGCPDRIHCIPLGFFCVDHCVCQDVEITRSNNYHTEFNHSTNVYIANVKLHEVKCVSGDGFGVAGAKHVFVNRCFMQSNDDGIVMSCHYYDPRGILWWTNMKDEDNGCRDITTAHSYINSGGGKALAFITWGTSDPIQEREEIDGVYAYDNFLTSVNPVGTWPDNPYNGRQPFDNSETDDYSPVKNVRILGNRYEGNCTLGPIACTNVITDCGVHSTSHFRNGDFTLGGLANWTLFKNSDPASIDTVIYADKEKGRISRFDKGEVCAAQGLYLAMGHHTFTLEIMTGDEGAELFVSEIETGKTLASETVRSLRPTVASLDFDITDREAADVFVGVRNVGVDPEGYAIFDQCQIQSQVDEEVIRLSREAAFMERVNKTFATGDAFHPLSENGKVYLQARAEGDLFLPSRDTYETFRLNSAIRLEHVEPESEVRGYGIRFGVRENGYRELRVCHSQCELRLIDVTDGVETQLYARPNFFFTSNDFHIFGLEVNRDTVNIWIDGALYDTVKVEAVSGRAGVFLCDAGVSLHDLKI